MPKSMAMDEFAGTCSAVLEQIEDDRQEVVLTRDGNPVLSISPILSLPPLQPGEDPLAIYRFEGVEIIGDITGPINDPDDWEYD
jgi:hypothetical protein